MTSRANLSQTTLANTVAVALVAATLVVGASAFPSATAGRQPPAGELEFRGGVGPGGANGWSQIVIRTLENEAFWAGGGIPGTCVKDGKVRRAGPDGAIDVMFQGYTGRAPIASNGSFAFRMKGGTGFGNGRFTVTLRGTFHGNNVVGRAKGRMGPDPILGTCTADAAFWAKRY